LQQKSTFYEQIKCVIWFYSQQWKPPEMIGKPIGLRETEWSTSTDYFPLGLGKGYTNQSSVVVV